MLLFVAADPNGKAFHKMPALQQKSLGAMTWSSNPMTHTKSPGKVALAYYAHGKIKIVDHWGLKQHTW